MAALGEEALLPYSTEFQEARRCIRYLAARGWELKRLGERHFGMAGISACFQKDHHPVYGSGEAAAEAVCRAFLATLALALEGAAQL